MLDELKDLAQKKAKAEEMVSEFRSKKEEEKIRKGVQSGRPKEFFEPVTEAIEKNRKTTGWSTTTSNRRFTCTTCDPCGSSCNRGTGGTGGGRGGTGGCRRVASCRNGSNWYESEMV